MLVLLLALVRADVVTVEIPEALIDGDIPANAAAYCRQHDLGPTPRGVACADAVLLDAGATLGRRSLARAARGDADGAVEDARRRTEIARQDAAAWRQYGLALLDRNHEGDARDAAAALELAVAGDPTDLGAAHSLARARALTKPPAALRVATFASAETCGLRRLLASARHHGVDVDVLGANRTGCVEIKFKRPSIRGLSRSERGAALWIRSRVSLGGRVRVWAENMSLETHWLISTQSRTCTRTCPARRILLDSRTPGRRAASGSRRRTSPDCKHIHQDRHIHFF
jgi:hypothetical protein